MIISQNLKCWMCHLRLDRSWYNLSEIVSLLLNKKSSNNSSHMIWLIDWLVDWLVFYNFAVSSVFQLFNELEGGGEGVLNIHLPLSQLISFLAAMLTTSVNGITWLVVSTKSTVTWARLSVFVALATCNKSIVVCVILWFF